MESFRDFLNYAEIFYDDALGLEGNLDSSKTDGLVISSFLFSFIALESFINHMMSDFSSLPEGILPLHERALLEEKDIEFVDTGLEAGQFKLSKGKKYRRLEDKIMFLVSRFGQKSVINRGDTLWQEFIQMKEKRDSISHHKKFEDIKLDINDANKAIAVTKNIIELVSKNVWGKTVQF